MEAVCVQPMTKWRQLGEIVVRFLDRFAFLPAVVSRGFDPAVERVDVPIFSASFNESEIMTGGDMNHSNRLPLNSSLPVAIRACEKFHKFRLRVCGVVRTLRDNVRSMPASALSLSLVIGLSACGPRLADRNIDAVNRLYEQSEKSGKALSIKEVEAVLGQPNRVESFPIEMQTTKELPGVRYYYKQDGRTIELHFVDNKLIRRVDHFGETPAPQESEQLRMPPRQPK